MPQVVTLPDFSARDDTFIRKAVAQSNVVINLIGEERETPRFGFEEVNCVCEAALRPFEVI